MHDPLLESMEAMPAEHFEVINIGAHAFGYTNAFGTRFDELPVSERAGTLEDMAIKELDGRRIPPKRRDWLPNIRRNRIIKDNQRRLSRSGALRSAIEALQEDN